MQAPDAAITPNDQPEVSLRPELPDDVGFLFQVYVSTRTEELALTNWDEATRTAFLTQQFNAMRRGYRAMFPAGEFLIIQLAGQPVGRMVLNRSAAQIRVVDVALLPEFRNQGIGTGLMRGVGAEAAGIGKVVTLSVLKFNRAGQWYARLGFTPVGEAGIYDEWEWRPDTGITGHPKAG